MDKRQRAKQRYHELRALGFSSKEAKAPLKYAKKETRLRDALLLDYASKHKDKSARSLIPLFRKSFGLSISDKDAYKIVREAKHKEKDIAKVRAGKRRKTKSKYIVLVSFRDMTQSVSRKYIEKLIESRKGRDTSEIERSVEGFSQTEFGVVPRSEWTFDIADRSEVKGITTDRKNEGMTVIGTVDPAKWDQVIDVAELIGLLAYGEFEKNNIWMDYMLTIETAGGHASYKRLEEMLF